MTERGTMTVEGQQVGVRAAALRYIEDGWHPLELPPHAKDPPPTGRTGRDGRDMSLEEVYAAAWVGNIGTRMPVDVIGLDLDAYRGGSLATLTAPPPEGLGPLPPTCIVHSGRDDGSGTRLFRVPVGFRWVAALPGIDILQRHHRYLMVPPSEHPDGRAYAVWDQAEGGPGSLWAVEDLPDLPWPWIEYLSRTEEGSTGGPVAVDGAEVAAFIRVCTMAEAPGYVTVITDRFDARHLEGYSRHDTMVHCTTWAMECARAGIVSAEVIINALRQRWEAAVSDNHRRAHGDEFPAMLRHAVGKAEGKSADEMAILHDGVCGIPFHVPTGDSTNGQAPPKGPKVETPGQLSLWPRAKDLPDPYVARVREWHAADLLIKPTHGELFGAEKSYKTWLGLIIDVGLAAGLPVLGQFAVATPQRVLLLVGEGGEDPWLERLAAVAKGYGVAWGDIAPMVRYTTMTASIGAPRFLEWLRVELEDYGPSLVHVDPYYAYASSQADSRQVTEVGAVLAALSALCEQHGASLLINHHTNRQESAPGLRQTSGAGHAEWVDSWLQTKVRSIDLQAGRAGLRLDVGSRQWGGASWDVDLTHDVMGLRWETRPAAHETEGDDSAADRFAVVKAEVIREGHKARKALTREALAKRVKRRREDVLPAIDELIVDGELVEVARVRIGAHDLSTYVVRDDR